METFWTWAPPSSSTRCMARFNSDIDIKKYSFLKLILLEHKTLLAFFGFATRQKWLAQVESTLENTICISMSEVKVHIAHKKRLPPLGPPQGPRLRVLGGGCFS